MPGEPYWFWQSLAELHPGVQPVVVLLPLEVLPTFVTLLTGNSARCAPMAPGGTEDSGTARSHPSESSGRARISARRRYRIVSG